MVPYLQWFDDFEILMLRFTILRNCPDVIQAAHHHSSISSHFQLKEKL